MKRKTFFHLAWALALVSMALVSCKTSTIAVNKAEMKQIKTIAVMKFESETGIDKNVAKECEDAFRGHFINLGKSVVEREKLRAILKEMEKSQAGIVSDNSIKIGQLSGAQALLFGSVTQNREEVKIVEYNEYDKKTKTYFKKAKKKKFYYFQVLVRLVSTSSGSTILTLKNSYPERDYEMTDFITLSRFREGILDQMGKDLKDALKEKK